MYLNQRKVLHDKYIKKFSIVVTYINKVERINTLKCVFQYVLLPVLVINEWLIHRYRNFSTQA